MPVDSSAGTRGIGGHPAGLTTLFLPGMWERFSCYGKRAILVVFMVAPAAQGGLGFSTRDAASLYGAYAMAVYLRALPGGYAGDRFLAPRQAVLFGGLTLIAIGTGLLKPNVSTMAGSLYAAGDPRRDSGFSIFYMGINAGALMAPLVCGWLAGSAAFLGPASTCSRKRWSTRRSSDGGSPRAGSNR